MAKMLLFAFKEVKTHSFSAPHVSTGSGEEAKKDLKEAYDRMTNSGKVRPEDDGLEVHILGIFDDNTAKFEILDEPEYLTTIYCKDGDK